MSSAQLILGDCLKVLRQVPDHSVDLILADLPYGVTKNGCDKIIPLDKLWDQYRRVAKADAAIILTATQPFATTLINSNPLMFKYDWVWVKSPVSPLNAKRRPMQAHESMLVFYAKRPVYNPQGLRAQTRHRGENNISKSKNYGKTASKAYRQEMTNYPTTVVSVWNTAQPQKEHPTQKPIELMEYLIKTYTDIGAMVLDNCMGSGTTGLAALKTNRNFIGIEKDPAYFDVATKRLSAHAKASAWLEGTDLCKVTIVKETAPPKLKRLSTPSSKSTARKKLRSRPSSR